MAKEKLPVTKPSLYKGIQAFSPATMRMFAHRTPKDDTVSASSSQSAAASILLDETESAGIDPETGREQFRKKKLGSTTSAAMLGA